MRKIEPEAYGGSGFSAAGTYKLGKADANVNEYFRAALHNEEIGNADLYGRKIRPASSA